MLTLYTIGALKTYTSPEAAHSFVRGSVWFTLQEALQFVDRVGIQGIRVQGGVFEVHLPVGPGSDATLEDYVKPHPSGRWFVLQKNAPLGACVHKGVDPCLN
jgi:hypothetical protein